MLYFYIGSLTGLLLLLILSAIWQLIAVFRLRSLLQEDRHMEKINLSTLKIHIIAFGVFILSQVFYLIVTFDWARTWQPSEKNSSLYNFSFFCYTIGTFIS